MQSEQWGVRIFANGCGWPVLALAFALLGARAGFPETVLVSKGRLITLAQVASDTAEHSPRAETKEERRTKSKARLLAGGAMVVLSLLVLAVGLALVRAFKR